MSPTPQWQDPRTASATKAHLDFQGPPTRKICIGLQPFHNCGKFLAATEHHARSDREPVALVAAVRLLALGLVVLAAAALLLVLALLGLVVVALVLVALVLALGLVALALVALD